MKLFIRVLSILLLLFILMGSFAGCDSDEKKNFEKKEFLTLADIEEATLGIVTGSNWDNVAKNKFPNAKRMYFTSPTDALLALKQGKIDSFFCDMPVYTAMRWENDDISCIDEPVEPIFNALILPKDNYDRELLDKINAFVEKTKADGTLDRLEKKWFSDAEPEEHPDYHSLTGGNGTIKIAVSDAMKPSSYQKGEDFTGYEVDFLTLFAEEYGYKLDIKGMSLDALMPSVASGRYDIGACGITITDERRETLNFADSHFETYGVAIIKKSLSANASQNFNSLDDLNGETVAVMTGTLWDRVSKEEIPNAKISHFSTTSDLILALDGGKVSAIVGPETFYVTAKWENKSVKVLDNTAESISSGFVMSKENYDSELLDKLNAFIDTAKKDGTINELLEKWMSDKEPEEHPDYKSLSAENGVLEIAVDDTAKPMVYRKGDAFTGFDVELLTKFAKAYGYGLEFKGMAFNSLISHVSEGRCDIGACGIGITSERAESVTFTDSYVEIGGVVIVGETVSEVEEKAFFEKLGESFEKTFIRESRWKLILEGVAVTMIISICSALLGTLLGFGLYMLSRSSVRLISLITRGFAKAYSRIIAGTPVVVILMIFFYVIFGSVRDMNGIVVAIIAFALVFGAFVYEHLTVSVDSVDAGQTEAALSLGYTKSKTFFRIIFPQAMKIFMPSYCSRAVELIKSTSVVGYIAVNDLTKMGEIIRSNTYEAFFPLIAIAVIYFLLTWMLASILGLVRKRFEPKRRSGEAVLKGVRTNDKN